MRKRESIKYFSTREGSEKKYFSKGDRPLDVNDINEKSKFSLFQIYMYVFLFGLHAGKKK